LFAPVEFAAGVYDALHEAGEAFGLVDAGYYALESLRLEMGYRAWGRELSPDVTPWQAGLGFSVALDKPGGFLGREALAAARAQPLDRRVVSFVAELADSSLAESPLAHGGEAVLADGAPCGEVASASFGHTLGGVVGLALLHAPGQTIDAAWLAARRFAIDIAGETAPVKLSLRAPYDPANARLRG
jgi:4-methylaminobutanoate oxidase (formaldehyde-forming)